MVENEIDLKIKTLRSYNWGEFISNELWNFCEEHRTKRKFSIARTPQQNGFFERKNRNVEEMARTMLNESNLNDIFWVWVVHTVVHIINIWLLKINNDQTPYGLWKGRLTNLKNFIVFKRKCYLKREDNKIGKLEPLFDEGIFFGYLGNRKGYVCYKLIIKRIVESINLKND